MHIFCCNLRNCSAPFHLGFVLLLPLLHFFFSFALSNSSIELSSFFDLSRDYGHIDSTDWRHYGIAFHKKIL